MPHGRSESFSESRRSESFSHSRNHKLAEEEMAASEPRRCQSLVLPACHAPPPDGGQSAGTASNRSFPNKKANRNKSQIFVVRRGIMADFLIPPKRKRSSKLKPITTASTTSDTSAAAGDACGQQPLPPPEEEEPCPASPASPATTCKEIRSEGLSWNGIQHLIVAIFHDRHVQLFFLLLLLADVALVITEILILTHKEAHVFKAEDCTNTSEIERPEPHVYVPPAGCGLLVEVALPHHLHVAEFRLKWASRSILFIFAAELVFLFLGLGKGFLTVPMFLDCIVIFGSIILEFTLSEEDAAASELIIFARCWRFLRILHGFGLTVHEVDHEIQEEEKKKKEEGEGETEKKAGGDGVAEPTDGVILQSHEPLTE